MTSPRGLYRSASIGGHTGYLARQEGKHALWAGIGCGAGGGAQLLQRPVSQRPTNLGALGGHWALTDSSEGIIIPAVISRDWGLYKAKRKPAVLDKTGGQVTVCPLASVSLLVLGYPSKIVTVFFSLQM